jgi:hypothetical protein
MPDALLARLNAVQAREHAINAALAQTCLYWPVWPFPGGKSGIVDIPLLAAAMPA